MAEKEKKKKKLKINKKKKKKEIDFDDVLADCINSCFPTITIMPYLTFLSIRLHQMEIFPFPYRYIGRIKPPTDFPFDRINIYKKKKKMFYGILPVKPVVRIPRIGVGVVTAEIVAGSRILENIKYF